MALKESIDRTIRNRMNKMADAVYQIIRQQIPQPGKNPFATGKLQQSLQVPNVNKSGDSWTIFVGYAPYGVYTNLGTKAFYGGIPVDTSPFNLPAYQGYSKGIGGIKPQYWTSVPHKLLDDLVEGIIDDYSKEIQASLKNLSV